LPAPRSTCATPVLRGVDLPQIQHMALNHAAATHALVLDKAPVAVLLAVLLANRRAQKHGDRQVTPTREKYNEHGFGRETIKNQDAPIQIRRSWSMSHGGKRPGAGRPKGSTVSPERKIVLGQI